jgi:ribosomal protein S18 acetylase RimI-like enzyme
MAMWVNPAIRGSGAGDDLVAAIVASAASEGARVVRLDVMQANDHARRCYERNGFSVNGHEVVREGDGRIQVRMERLVNSPARWSVAILAEAREQDAEPIAKLHIASWQATYARELPEAFLRHPDLAARTMEWRRCLAEGTAVLVAEEGDGIVGFVACGPVRGTSRSAGEWEIYNLHVAPLRRGKGLGSRLFDAAVRLGREQGARELVLWVVKTNGTARAFYEAKGMRWDGGEQEHALGGVAKLDEVRYRMVSQVFGRLEGMR